MSTDSTASAAATATTSGSTTNSLTGCVKWFDNGLNYGFITVLSEGEHKDADIFVHQSNIRTGRDCFRTLYTGECVQFDLTASNNEKHPYHAVNVHGFNGTLLHCENPNYRPRRGMGRGRGRGGFRGERGAGRNTGRGNQQQSASSHSTQNQTVHVHDQVNTEQTTQADKPDVTPSVQPTTQVKSADTNASTAGKRGRGRGRKVSA
jgi:cold shock CspA family protein